MVIHVYKEEELLQMPDYFRNFVVSREINFNFLIIMISRLTKSETFYRVLLLLTSLLAATVSA